MAAHTFDVVVIGAGPGGYVAAIRAAVGSEDPQMALPGLMALAGSVAAEFDKTLFRAPVRKWMISKIAA